MKTSCRTHYPFRHFVNFNVEEVQILIEVLVFEQAFTDHLRKENHNVASATTFWTQFILLHLQKGNNN